MGKKSILLTVIAVLLLAASISLFVVRQVGSRDYVVATYDEVLEMPATRVVYRSINNWETVEDTEFEGVPLYTFLEKVGVKSDEAEVKLMAPDEYFWPAVGTVLTLSDLKQANADGLYPLLAWEVEGDIMQPEPRGSGPLRLVMPQYWEEHVNKPSWVSNLRLIEIGPVEEGIEAPDATTVPVDEIWIYGDVPAVFPFSILIPIVLLLAGIAALVEGLILHMSGRRKGRGAPGAAAQILLLLAVASLLMAAYPLLAPQRCACRANPGAHTFSMGELRAMPAFSAHYTFLKSQEPYTYYEADYRGVPLAYILEQRLNLAPGATGVQVLARDGYKVSLSLDQVRTIYSGGLKVIIAYERDGTTLGGEEKGLRLVVPQTVPGKKEQGGDANTPLCARKIYAVEVLPLGAGEQAPAPGTVPEGSLAVIGAVSEPAPAPSQPSAPDAKPEEAEPQDGEGPEDDAGDEEAAAQLQVLHTPEGAFYASRLVSSSLRLQPLEAALPLSRLVSCILEAS